ncbi:hypothetical protein GOBAR_DD01245 [Gossypium barbadense]|nr:hypothetical protein GOBAR_DD01245 [Gossypium barbadense]
MLVNNLSESFNKMILEAKGKPILTMMETIRKKLDVNIKDSLRCVSSHVGGNRYQVECSPSSQHMVDLVENSCSCRNWDLTGIPCMHALAVIHLKDEFLETYIDIYSNFIRPVRGPKQWVSLSNILPILPHTLRRPPGRPTKVRRKELDEPQTTERLSKRGVDMTYSQKIQSWCSQLSGCLNSTTGYPKSVREYPNSAREYPNSTRGCPNSVTNCPN